MQPSRPVRPIICLCTAGMFLALSAGGATADERGMVELTLHVTGSVTADIQTRRILDTSHTCALVGPPKAEQTLVLGFNQRPTEVLLAATDFGFSLSIPGVVGKVWDETRPSTLLQIALANRRFVGLHDVDPEFRLSVSVDPGGDKGTFEARHVAAVGSKDTIDMMGSWACAASAPAGDGSPALSDTNPVSAKISEPPPLVTRPATADATNKPGDAFRIFRAGRCSGHACDVWRVVDLRSGRTSSASVDFRHLRMSPALLAAARAGKIELWISGDAGDDQGGLRIEAKALQGVVPRRP